MTSSLRSTAKCSVSMPCCAQRASPRPMRRPCGSKWLRALKVRGCRGTPLPRKARSRRVLSGAMIPRPISGTLNSDLETLNHRGKPPEDTKEHEGLSCFVFLKCPSWSSNFLFMTEKILAPLFVFINSVIATTGYGGIVLLLALPAACIPLPAELIMPFPGFFVLTGTFKLFWGAEGGASGQHKPRMGGVLL